jgi:hypothetical protein
MRQRLLKNVWTGRLLVTVLAVLIVSLGVCLVQDSVFGMDGHQGMSPDSCASLVMLTVILLTLLGLAAVGRLLADPARPVYAVSLVRLDPPPKSPSFS